MHLAVFHLALGLAELAAFMWLRRRRTLLRLVGAIVVVGVAGVLAMGVALTVLAASPDAPARYAYGFAAMGLADLALFLHLPLDLALVVGLYARARRPIAATAGVALSSLVAVGVWAHFVEPTRLQLTRHVVTTDALDEPLRIVILADIQTDDVGAYEERALRLALEQQPDLILLPGDYVHAHRHEDWLEQRARLNRLFHEVELRAPLGVVAVEGNCERPGWPALFEGLEGVDCIVGRGTVQLGPVVVTGIDLRDSFTTQLDVPRPQNARFHIVVGHSPSFALGSIDADLLVAGHTHGGQIVVPGFGPPIILSAIPRWRARGLSWFDDGRALVVSAGIGMERGFAPEVRLFCPPEVVVVDLVPRH